MTVATPEPGPRFWARLAGFFQRRPWLSPLFAAVLVAIAITVIWHELDAVGVQGVIRALNAIHRPDLTLAIGCAAASYLCLILGERTLLPMLGKEIPLARMWRGSFTAYALGNALGFSVATAPAVRARFYRGLLSPAEIAAISALTGASIFMAAAMAAGLGALLGASEFARHGVGTVVIWRAAGAALLAPLAIWLGFLLTKRREDRIGGVPVRWPSLGRGLVQAFWAAGDWLAAAAVLYALLPGHGGWSFPAFVVIFVVSGMLGAISGAPGGIGVFEASVLALAPHDGGAPGIAAALLAYRIIYTIAPLMLAALLLGGDIVQASPSPAGRVAQRLSAAAIELAPQIFAALTFAGGLVLLLSSATPALIGRLKLVSRIFPLYVVELSHFLASIIGLLLMAMAAALWRRRAGAYVLTLLLLLAGAVFALLKGADYEEAIILLFVAGALAPCRRAFTRQSRLLSEALSVPWLLAVLGAAAAAGWLGFFAYRHVPYSDELWWTFLRDDEASRFLRAMAGGATLAALLSAWTLIAPSRRRWRGRPDAAAIAQAQTIIAKAEALLPDAHLALLGDKDLLFSRSGQSFLMFRAYGPRWIAMSEPCGLARERRELLWRFVELADEAGAAPVFYSIRSGLLADIAELGMIARKIGETAVVRIQEFSLEGKARANLRTARNKLEREGATFEMIPAGQAHLHEGGLRAISDEWLHSHKSVEKAFSLGRFDLAYLNQTPIAAVSIDGEMVAFANLWAAANRREMTVDLMRYSLKAPKTVMDYLFVRLIEWAKAEGYGEFDLGMAPLSGLDSHRLAPAFARIGATVYEEGEAIYGFRGLRAYKEKFAPEWRPLYLAARPGPMASFALLDVALLTSGGWRGLFGLTPKAKAAPERKQG